MQPRLTLDEFIRRSKLVHGDECDYSHVEYVNVKTPVAIICRKHGPFTQAPEQHMLGHGCPVCAKEKRKASMLVAHGVEHASQSQEMQVKSRATRQARFGSMKPPGSGRKAMTTEEFVGRARGVHGDRYDYSMTRYVNSTEKVVIGCPVHGPFEQLPLKHLQGRGCPHPECVAKKKVAAMARRAAEGRPGKLDKNTFVARARAVHGDFYDYSRVEYRNTKTKVEIVCPVHGSFFQTPEKHMAGSGCPSPECLKARMEATNMAKYGTAWPLQSDAVKAKARATSLERYGAENVMQSDVGKARMAEACQEKFGTDSPLASPDVREKIVATNQKKYGGASPLCSEEIKARSIATNVSRRGVTNAMMDAAVKAKQQETLQARHGVDNPMRDRAIRCQQRESQKATMIERYGADSGFGSEELRAKARETNRRLYGDENVMRLKQFADKMTASKIANGTCNTSAPEDVLYEMLCEVFGDTDVVRQYASDAYPYACDFYIRSRDLYIELNGTWTHGGHWYRPGSDGDVVAKWWEKAGENPYYVSAASTWTIADMAKRAAARMAGLNYVVFWGSSLDDAALWLAMGCPDGKDWEREYSWIPDRTFQGVPLPAVKAVPSAQDLSQVMKHYQFRAFYARELELWEKDPVHKNMPLRGFLYANRHKYTGKLPDELSDLQLIRGFTISGVLKGYTVFDTTAMDEAVTKYGILSVYDPCAGWGERMLYCHYHGIPYVGVDVNGALEPGYEAMMEELGMERQRFVIDDSSRYVPNFHADAVVACPPYGGIEIYSAAGAENLDDAGFLAWWAQVVSNAMAANPRMFCFQINRRWRDNMLEIVEKAGFRLVDEIFCQRRSSHLTRGKGGVDHKREQESMLVLERIVVI